MKGSADSILRKILSGRFEDEVIELGGPDVPTADDLGKRFSALSNEANLLCADSAWMVFGISAPDSIVGCNCLDRAEEQKNLQNAVRERASDGLTFTGIYERRVCGCRILLLEVPSAPEGHPTTFDGFAYMIQDTGAVPMDDDTYGRILWECATDWSAELVPGATIDDIDPIALEFARESFLSSRPSMADECRSWSDETLLDMMGLRRDDGMTNAALILLGKEEAVTKMRDAPMGLRWILKDGKDNVPLDSEIFGTPYLCSVEKICGRIRSIGCSIRRNDGTERRVQTYDRQLLREALYNCICHQDYSKGGLVTVVEFDRDHLLFNNQGVFLPGRIENVLMGRPVPYHRNALLHKAVCRLGLTEVDGGGIMMMCLHQTARGFPLPEIESSDHEVTVTIVGRTVDPAYASILREMPDMPLSDVATIDAVSKGQKAPSTAIRHLKALGILAEGDGGPVLVYPPRNGAESSIDLKDAIVSILSEKGPSDKRSILVSLKMGPLCGIDPGKAYSKASNALTTLRRRGTIRNVGTSRKPVYVLADLDVSPRTRAPPSRSPAPRSASL